MLGPGSRLGPYQIEGVLGEGGMGTVYRARDSRLDRPVAIKVLRAEVAADLAVSPDGRHLHFTQLDYSGSDLMLVEHFR